MTLEVIQAGLQTTLQGTPFSGHRHIGMPAAGAADCLSHALANKLVGKAHHDVSLEITLDPAEFVVHRRCHIALTGAAAWMKINNEQKPLHRTIAVEIGDNIQIASAVSGCRSYLAVSANLDNSILLGSGSTLVGAALGGHQGRALIDGDIIDFGTNTGPDLPDIETPEWLRPVIGDSFIARATTGPEYEDHSQLFSSIWHVDHRASRMGMILNGRNPGSSSHKDMKSSPVFPGTVQWPANGAPILLGPDAQTTGGYPRLAQVIRADRHLIGQLKPGSKLQLVEVPPHRAREIYLEKRTLLQDWLEHIQLW